MSINYFVLRINKIPLVISGANLKTLTKILFCKFFERGYRGDFYFCLFNEFVN